MQRTANPHLAVEETQENIFGYEPVIIMEMQTVQSDITFDAKQIKQGVPQKNYMVREQLQLDFYNEEGEHQHSLPLANPGELLIHGEAGEELIQFPKTTYRFAVPYEKGMQTMQYKFKDRTSLPIPVK